MTRVAILQARTNSSRLPAKVLLPIGGLPLAVLAARRAGNTGLPVIIATSEAHSDDELSCVCNDHQLEVFRGSLNDTLGRMVAALDGWPDDTIVVRLTADNAVPDGALLDALTAALASHSCEYLVCGGAGSGLPYGVSAEAFRLRRLREAGAQATTAYDREHVTPWLRRKYGSEPFRPAVAAGLAHLRCTIDSRDDYELMTRTFRAVSDPVTASIDELLTALAAHWPYPASDPAAAGKLVLGTAQLGMPYGISNQTGMPTAAAAADIIKTAVAAGVEWLDTARAYGASEQVIAASLSDGWQGRVSVITKLSMDRTCTNTATPQQVPACVDASVFHSAAALRQKPLDVVMLHRGEHLTAWNGAVLRTLRQRVADGVISRLGVSVQNPAELLMALEHADIEFIQLPFNLLDWRWDDCVAPLQTAREDRPLVVHARSALLQGLLPNADPQAWAAAHCAEQASVRQWLNSAAATYSQSDIVALALAYVRSMDWIDGVVVGVERIEQLHANLQHFAAPLLTPAEVTDLHQTRPRVGAATLNPAQWKPI